MKKRSFFGKLFSPLREYFENRKKEREEKRKLKRNAEYVKLRELERIEGNLEEFEKFLLEGGKIGIILGARGSGKSALGMRLIENIKARTGKKVFALGFKKEKLPKWINFVSNTEDVFKIPNNSYLLADESGIKFSSRSFMSSVNKLLSELLLISRHKNISIIFITQNSANIEVNTLRQADYLLLRKSSLLQLDFERKKIREIYKDAEKKFKKYSKDKGLTYIYSDVYRGFISNSLPSFWTEGLSKSFS